MKLIDHVLKIRSLIARAISNRFERFGITDNSDAPVPSLTEADKELRTRLKEIVDYHYANSGDYAEARKQTINEFTFTLFNRLAALKIMEGKEFFPEIIARRAEYGGRSFEHNAWLEQHPEGRSMEREGLVQFIEDIFRRESDSFPIYAEKHPYALMPRADELNEIIDSFNDVAADTDCGENIWRGDDILGWLYENFNAVEKAKLKEDGGKTEYDKVSLQSQVYTPQWVVKFLVDNTVGKMYLEMHPDSRLCDLTNEDGSKKYLIANRPTERTRNMKPLEQLRIIDPACGSGNFLIYTMSLLYDLYLDQADNFGADYSRREIPALIVEKNLYGVDLDERAVQLSQIALRIKARELGGRRARSPKKTNVVASNFFLPPYDDVRHMVEWSDWDDHKKKVVEKVWNDLAQAAKFGSLVRVEQPLKELVERQSIAKEGLFAGEDETSLFSFTRNAIDSIKDQVRKYASFGAYTNGKVEDAMTFLDIISKPFDVAVANPPYTDSGDFGTELKEFVEENYKIPYKFHTNLYATFIRRCWEITSETGKIGMIHPHTFMFIKSFEDVRKFLIEKTSINVMVDFGLDRVNLFGPGVLLDATFYTLDKGQSNLEGIYFDITNGLQEKFKKDTLAQAFKDLCEGRENSRVYHLPQDKLKQIKSWPFIYWISDDFRKKFGELVTDDISDIRAGIQTSDNYRFLRYPWEISDLRDNDNPNGRWVLYAKGGPYCKWFGNIWLTIDWKEEGSSLQRFLLSRGQDLHAQEYYFRDGITYSSKGSGNISFRQYSSNYLFDIAGSCVFTNGKYNNLEYYLGLLNSNLISYIIDCLNPTVNKQPNDLKRIPFVIPQKNKEDFISKSSIQNVNIKKLLTRYSLIEPLFEGSPITPEHSNVIDGLKHFYVLENALLTQVLLNEAVINREVFDIYELSDNDRRMVLEKEGTPVGNLPVTTTAVSRFVEYMNGLNKEELTDVLGKWQILDNQLCVTYPNGQFVTFDFEIVDDDQSKKLDFERLYQKNYEWEEYCIQNNVNPIESWYRFIVDPINLPSQRTQVLAFELITDVIRTLLEKDDDGVIPLVDRTGEGLLADRIQRELVERGYSNAQIFSILQLLGMPLDRYLRDKFFQQLSDHLNLFMYLPKTPFIWHLTSGPLHAMELYVSIYRWNRNTLSRVKSVYCANRESALRDRLAVLAKNTDTSAQSEAADIRAQLRELAEFTDKLDALLASGYDPKLDDGVGKNIAPLQKARLLSYAVLKETGGAKSQLNKFLNADW